ncbi:MarR family transcriptional regulator [Pendulispora brunnea]|uniref:MarR family transcriptional regulator n=1 Tax=Pendulispora brunnea TaxID=2905690 RepID=A0ABZ2KB00_9BACT
MPRAARSSRESQDQDAVALAQRTLLEGVGAEVAASFPGVTRLGGQIVAALYLAEGPVSMDELSLTLGRSKSNIFGNLKNLEAAGIVERQRISGERFDAYSLRGKYPDVIIGAYLARLRRVVADKRALSQRALSLLGDARGKEAEALRTRLHDLSRKYDRFGVLFEALLPGIDGPFDLESLLDAVPVNVISVLASLTRRAAGLTAGLTPPREKRNGKK